VYVGTAAILKQDAMSMTMTTTMLEKSFSTALTNVVLFVGLPFFFYWAFHKLRRKRSLGEVLTRAGLRFSIDQYFGYCLAVTAVVVTVLILIPLPVDALTREGSSWHRYVGLGLGWPAVPMALLYGVIQTGFCEEFFFRGLIAGSLSRRLPLKWANLIQSLIFLLPHLLILKFMPEMWPMLLFVFGLALFCGWVRIKSKSIAGPWLLHGVTNIATALVVAVRSAA
jgi:membrane protease YdiL (CAAX protease family)